MRILEEYGEMTEKKNEVRISGEQFYSALGEIHAIAPKTLIITRRASDAQSSSKEKLR